MKMRKERKALADSENAIEVLEFLKSARTLKRQLMLIRGIQLDECEEQTIKTVLEDLRKQFSLFRV
jgi:hypothetical protein